MIVDRVDEHGVTALLDGLAGLLTDTVAGVAMGCLALALTVFAARVATAAANARDAAGKEAT